MDNNERPLLDELVGLWERQRDNTLVDCHKISNDKVECTYSTGGSLIYDVTDRMLIRQENSKFKGSYGGDELINWNNKSSWKKHGR